MSWPIAPYADGHEERLAVATVLGWRCDRTAIYVSRSGLACRRPPPPGDRQGRRLVAWPSKVPSSARECDLQQAAFSLLGGLRSPTAASAPQGSASRGLHQLPEHACRWIWLRPRLGVGQRRGRARRRSATARIGWPSIWACRWS